MNTPNYVIRDPFYSNLWREASTMRAAYKIAYSNARTQARCHTGFSAEITRVYDGDDNEYQRNPISRVVFATGDVYNH